MLTTVVLLTLAPSASAQEPPAPVLPAVISPNGVKQATVRAVKLSEPLRIDGRLDEAIYSTPAITAKAAANLAKHGVPFDEASTVFADADGLDGPDVQHSANESRRLRLGRSAAGRTLIVAYTLRRTARGEAIRIISARRGSRKERTAYARPQAD